MKKLSAIAATALAALSTSCAQQPSANTPATVERVYVIDCGENRTTDLSMWSPGFNVGKSWEFSNHCYLIKHAKGWMIWDTGNSDSLTARPDGITVLNGRLNIRMPKPLAESLKEIGVAPTEIGHLAMSHLHADHSGNANLFTAATLYMQEPEYEAAFGATPQKFGFNPATYDKLRGNPAVKLKGEHDVFGDGSVVIRSAPGHTIGHQVLFVRMKKTGPVLLSGDAVHFRENWEQARVPAMNYNRDQSAQSMHSIKDFLAASGATLWINHDKAQSSTLTKAPGYVE